MQICAMMSVRPTILHTMATTRNVGPRVVAQSTGSALVWLSEMLNLQMVNRISCDHDAAKKTRYS